MLHKSTNHFGTSACQITSSWLRPISGLRRRSHSIGRPGILQVRHFFDPYSFSSDLSIFLLFLCIVCCSSDIQQSLHFLDPRTLFRHLHTVSLPRTTAMSASGSGVPNAGISSSLKKQFPQVDLQGNDLPPSPAPSSPHAGRRYNIATELVFTEGNDQYNASSVPIYQVRFAAKQAPIQKLIHAIIECHLQADLRRRRWRV